MDVLLAVAPQADARWRLGGELWWAHVPVPDTWWCAHLVKKSRSADHQHHLAPRPGDDLARDVAVCLGGQALAGRGRGAGVRAGARHHAPLARALEPQWSLRVAVGTAAVAGTCRAATRRIGHVA